ncbi:MAG: flagellar protein FlaG [Acidobacteriota bacterium]
MHSIDGVGNVNHAALAAPSPVPAERLPEHRELIQAVKAVNAAEYFDQNSELTIMLDRETKRPIVRLVDRKTNEVIRQIPPEYVLRLSEDLRSADSGR